METSSVWWIKAGSVITGLVLGGLLVQGAYRLEFLPLDGYTFFLPMILISLVAALVWRFGHRWFAASLAAGAIAWTAFVLWVVIEFARGMENFP